MPSLWRLKFGFTSVGYNVKLIASGILTKAPKSMFNRWSPLKSIPTYSSTVSSLFKWYATGNTPVLLTVHASADHMFLTSEYPLPYSVVKYRLSIVLGNIIVSKPLIIQLLVISLTAPEVCRSNTPSFAQVIS